MPPVAAPWFPFSAACMPAWRLGFLGLAAWCCGASQDGQLLKIDIADSRAQRGGRQLSEFTEVCPRVRKNSLKKCDRCISNEMCPFESGKQWICHPAVKQCAHPAWGPNETITHCPEHLDNYTAWSAMCKYSCDAQKSPFSCAGFCLNEDFPCNWVPNCFANNDGDLKGMTPDSPSCLRPCKDHDAMLKVSLKYMGMADHMDTCAQAVNFYFGCKNQFGAPILEHCPQTCRTKECEYRCGKTEIATTDGRQCWQLIERTIDQYTCAEAIAEGIDCHCKCASAYLQVARAGGGAFRADGFYGDETVGYNRTVVADSIFDVSLTGQAMNVESVEKAWGPRIKIIIKGGDCQYAPIITTIDGLECVPPPPGSASATTASTCVTAPDLYSPYLHRWSGLKLGACGNFDVCHCNTKCDLTESWHHVGSITVTPPEEIGGSSKPLPGCQREPPRYMPNVTGKVETKVNTLSSISLKIYGGLDADPELQKPTKEAAINALVYVTKAYSKLLIRDVPHATDIEATLEKRRLREAWPADTDTLDVAATHARRMALVDECVDDDRDFKLEAAKANVFFNSCADLSASFGYNTAMFCEEKTLEKAVKFGCMKTCSLCPHLTTILTTPKPTMAPDLRGGAAMSYSFEITTLTDFSAANVLGRLTNLKDDAVPYTQRLHKELKLSFEAAGVSMDKIPKRLWVNMTAGPTQALLGEEEAQEAETEAMGTKIFLYFGLAMGGACVLGMLFVLVWYCIKKTQRKNAKVMQTPIETVTKVSDGGYRIKKQQVGGDIIEPEKEEPDCCERVCTRCYRRCCPKRKLKKARVLSQESTPVDTDPSHLKPGTVVKLFGLSSAHYNGLTGTIRSGPNDKGRYEVDLKVVDDYATEEQQTLSFKPDNMRIIEVVEEESEPSPLKRSNEKPAAGPNSFLPAGQGGSYLNR